MTKETYFEELPLALQRRELLPRPMEGDGLFSVEWNGRILYRVMERGVAQYDPTWVDTDGAKVILAQVTEATGTITKYMRLLETTPSLKVENLIGGYRVSAEFNGMVLTRKGILLGARFVTWAWGYDWRGVSNGHYYTEDYQTAKEDFTFRSGLMAREQAFDRERLEEPRQAAQGFLCGEGPASYQQESRCQRILDQIRPQSPEPKQN